MTLTLPSRRMTRWPKPRWKNRAWTSARTLLRLRPWAWSWAWRLDLWRWMGLLGLLLGTSITLAWAQTTPPLATTSTGQPSTFKLGAYVWPVAQSLEYKMALKTHGFTLPASATLEWQTQGARYQAQLEMRLPLVGSRRQHSSGVLSAQGVEPLRFSDNQRKELTATVDRERARIELADHAGSVPLQKEHQDALSVYFELAGLLGGLSPPYPIGQTLTLPLFMVQTTEMWPFKLIAQEPLTTPMGVLNTFKIERLNRFAADTQHVELWLAPSLGFLPARILIEQTDGERIEQWVQSQKP